MGMSGGSRGRHRRGRYAGPGRNGALWPPDRPRGLEHALAPNPNRSPHDARRSTYTLQDSRQAESRSSRQMAKADLEKTRVGFIGCGAMARALAGGLRRSRPIAADQILAADPFATAARRASTPNRRPGRSSSDNAAVVAGVRRRRDSLSNRASLPAILAELDAEVRAQRPLWISIAAGVSRSNELCADALPPMARESCGRCPTRRLSCARAATAYFPGPGRSTSVGSRLGRNDPFASRRLVLASAQRGFARCRDRSLRERSGLRLPDSSRRSPTPAFARVCRAMTRVRNSRPEPCSGSAQSWPSKPEIHPGELKDQVTSPGGTTIAGLEQLEAGMACGQHSTTRCGSGRRIARGLTAPERS